MGEELEAFFVGLLRGESGDRTNNFIEAEVGGFHVELAGLDF